MDFLKNLCYKLSVFEKLGDRLTVGQRPLKP